MSYTKGKLHLHDTEKNIIVGEDTKVIADVYGVSRSQKENRANAKRIICCVNAHDKLLWACRQALLRCQTDDLYKWNLEQAIAKGE